MSLAEKLKEGIASRTVFTVFGIDIDEATAVTWIVMAVITLYMLYPHS